MDSNLTASAYYAIIYNYLQNQIDQFGLTLMGNMMGWVASVAAVLFSMWVMLQGYRIVTGQSREPMMQLVINSSRNVVVITIATTMAFMGSDLHTLLTRDLDASVNQIFTGDRTTTVNNIDKSLVFTQMAMSALDAVQVVPTDTEMQNVKSRAQLMAALGTASPPMVAGAMLLLYQFGMALVIGLGPLFILCLLFDQTKELFRKWLFYGIGTVFSMAALSAVCSIVLGLTIKVGAAYWASKLASSLMGNSAEGLTNQAMQQGGIGVLMTMLIISVPPMAAMFFQGTMGNFFFQPAFGMGGLGGRQGPNGQLMPAPQFPPSNTSQPNAGQEATSAIVRMPGTTYATQTDVVKTTNSTVNPLQGR